MTLSERDGFVAGRGSITTDAITGRPLLELSGLDGSSVKAFAPDIILPNTCTQRETYSTCVAPLVIGVLSGTNAAVIAYGQTGSGKTHVSFCGTSIALQ